MTLALYLAITCIISLLVSGLAENDFQETIIGLIGSIGFSTIFYFLFIS